MKIAMIDNYDSFTYNLVHLVKELGAEVTVFRNDQFALSDLESFDKIMLSPGPGIPSEAGLLLDVIRTYAGKKPILGVCLGHQAIGEAFGGKLENRPLVRLLVLILSTSMKSSMEYRLLPTLSILSNMGSIRSITSSEASIAISSSVDITPG